MVSNGSTSYTVEATSKVEDGDTYVWSASKQLPISGKWTVKADSKFKSSNSYLTTAQNGEGEVFVTNSTDTTTTVIGERRASDEVINLIANYEGFLSKVTADSITSDPTLGYGKVVTKNEQFYNNLTKNQAYAYLCQTVNKGGYTTKTNAYLTENNIKFNYNQVEMFHLGCNVFTDNTGTHTVKTFVFGDENVVKGTLSSALGAGNVITADCGIALGTDNVISGVNSTAIGLALKASGHDQTVVGQYNIEDTTNKYSFIVGNGSHDIARSNALAVSKLGDVEINGNSVNKCFGGEVGHWYSNSNTLISSKNHSVLEAFTNGTTSKLNSLISKNSKTKITIKCNGLYALMLRAHVAPRTAHNRIEIVPFINGSRFAMYASSATSGLAYTTTTIMPYILQLYTGDTVEMYAKLIDNNNSVEVTLGDVMMYALDYEGKYR